MIPIVSVVGKSDSGKTTLLEKLIAELTRRGYRVATVKHDVHGFDIDREGKDSWRHKKAGATTTIISSPHKLAVISDTERDSTLSELREKFISGEDIILSEGYYRDSHPKIEVSQKTDPRELLCQGDASLIAVASSHPMTLSIPWFNLNNIKGIADFIEMTFLKKSPLRSATHDLSGVILAGGKNTRMGTHKAFLEVGGQKIIDRTVELFREIFNQVILVTNEPLAFAYLDVEIVVDLIPKSGSLVGIYTGLFYSSSTHSFIVACDMPLLSRKVIEYMVNVRGTYDVVIPHLSDGYHPLHALYAKRCMKYIEELNREGNLKITDFFNKVKVREVTTKEINPLDPALHSFINLNTPEEYEKVQGLK